MATVSVMFTITDVGDLNGRNLVLNSGVERSGTVPSSRDYVYVSSYSVSEFGKSLVHTQNQQLTISCEYEVTGNSLDTAYIYFQLNGSQTTPDNRRYVLDDPTGDFQVTFKVTSAQASTSSSYIRARLFHASAGSVLTIKNVKLEVGDTATDWTPAPEDVVTAMADAKEAKELADTKNSVYYQATAPTGNLKDGDTWFDTSKDYKISRWNAGTQEWAAAELGNQAVGNLDASHINTGTLTAVHIEAGKSQDVAGTIKVYDEDDDIKVSLDKDGLVATKGTIGGWEIDETSLSLSVPYQYNSSGEQVIAHGDDTDLIQLEDPQLVGASGDDANISLLTFGRDQSDGIPYILCDDGTLDGSQVRVKNGKISCLKNDNTLTNGISTYIQSDAVVLSESSVVNNITRVRNVRLKSDKVEVLYTPDYENATSENIQRAQLTRYNLTFSGDSTNPALATGIAHWTIFAQRRTIKDELGVTIYHCGNLFWAHFDGKMTVGWKSRMEEYISIYPNDDASFTNSQLCAPPSMLEKYCLPQSPANPRAIYRVFPDGQLGLYHFIPPTNGTNNYEVLTYDNWEPCDIFWAHIG